ncbi:fluoride efflux transporter CrcB [Rhodopila sp.]|uniref:fluoride efflux transporter CrcB n=1 Tax=Rhodopila sp. TaxID=2480087 RepID=UPI003D0D2603
MIACLYVALGGALGSVGRYGFGLMASRVWGDAFPWGTIAINIVGSFVIGFVGALTVADGAMPAGPNLRAFVMVGVCGGFTTFSSFSLQTFSLARDGNWFGAMGNIMLSIVLCLLAVTAGQMSAERIGAGRKQAGFMSPTILALLDRPETARSVLAAAALAADRFGSGRIEALHIRYDAMEDFMPTEDVMTEDRQREVDGRAARRTAELHALFDAWLPRDDAATWRDVTGETAKIVTAEAANAGLIVMGRPPASHPGGMRQALHAALFDARLLTLLVPDVAPGVLGQHVAVAWKPSEAVDKVIEAGRPLLLRADRVTVLIGREEAGHEAEPANLLRALTNAHVPVEVKRFQVGGRSIGEAILAEARLVEADLLVMGAYTRSRIIEMMLGGATRDVLANADLPVLLHH